MIYYHYHLKRIKNIIFLSFLFILYIKIQINYICHYLLILSQIHFVKMIPNKLSYYSILIISHYIYCLSNITSILYNYHIIYNYMFPRKIPIITIFYLFFKILSLMINLLYNYFILFISNYQIHYLIT